MIRYSKNRLEKETEIVEISSSLYHVVALRTDGTVIAVGKNKDGCCEVVDWTDIIQVVADNGATYGLKSDGTVVTTKERYQGEISQWKNVIQLQHEDDGVFGITEDSEALFTDSKYYPQTQEI